MATVYSYVHTVPVVTVNLYILNRNTKYILLPMDLQLNSSNFCEGIVVIFDVVFKKGTSQPVK